MLVVSLVLNVVVLVPVLTGLVRDAGWARSAFGPATPARGILTAVYAAILVGSLAALAAVLAGSDAAAVPALTLLSLQVVYKVLSPVAVGDLRNPVVRSNLVIAAVHVVTLITTAPAASVWAP
jgi:hypothetical protein